ncbi:MULTISPECIES: RND family transporter [unclassified Thioalkalivibrio]|uniref:efflux RND transporter permease subunit n=1 Tax=unclassified Thioalkalivibrio TaxID=2621013 RepID=UPI0003651D29|nr:MULTISPECIES: MMPL family transporter [unclassified Thioalkalivibrio]
MRWLRGHPLLALGILALLILLPGPVLLQVNLDNAPESYFPEDAPAVTFDRELRERFPQDQVLVGLFTGSDLFETDFLERIDALAQDMEADPTVERVLSVTTLDHIRATADGFTVDRLVDGRALDERTPEQWRERVLRDRFAPGLVAGTGGEALAVIVRPHALDNSLQRLQLERLLRDRIGAHDLEDELAAIAGHIALDVAQLRAMVKDLAFLVPGTMTVSLLLLWWLFRRPLVVVLSAATISAVTGPAIALLILLDRPFTLISAILPPLLTALTVAMLMHFFNAMLHAAQRGHQGRARVEAALAAVARPTWFMALTTAAGLASLQVSSIRPIETFGLIGAFGVLLAAAIVLLLLPAIMGRWDRGDWLTPKRGLLLLDRVTALAAHLAIRRAGWVLLATAILLALAIPQIRHVEVETDLYAFFDDNHSITQATRAVESELSGVMALEVVFDGPDWDSLQDPGRLQAIQRVQHWLDQRPEVDYSLSLPDLVAEMHWAFNEEDPDYRRIPDDPNLVAQYLFIYDGRDLFDAVDRDFERSRILLNLNAHGARSINALMDDLRGYLEANPPADLEWDMAGMARLFADQERLLIQGQLHSLYAVAAMITLLMLLMWRSVPLTLLSMIPNLAPVAMIFALMGLLGIWLDMATAMIASVAIGIAVDDTIHILHNYRQRRGRGSPVAWALARSFRRSGRAITATTIVLVAQFLLLALSDFQPTAAFGWLTAFGLIAALLFDLLVLPAMLVVAHRLSRARTA